MAFAVALLALACAPAPAAAQSAALDRAHAHNDYEHPRPLLDALAHGFNSIEVDVHLVDGALLVAHDREDVQPDRTLERLYLDPLRERARQHGGPIHPGSRPLLLLIDVKSDAEATYAQLHSVLRRYADLLTIYTDSTMAEGAVSAVISGQRSRRAMRATPIRFAAFDGRLPDLEGGADWPTSFMPLVSESWGRITPWRGEGPPPAELGPELARRVQQAHDQGRRLRFWGTPDDEAVWTLLREAGVDLINTDDLAGLRSFLLRTPR